MRILLYLGIAGCLAGMGVAFNSAILSSRDADSAESNPGALSVTDDGFVSDYFDLSYRLPPGWAEGLPGPPPSQSGYYVLGNWTSKNAIAGTVLVAAQDKFFEPDSPDDLTSVVAQFRQVMSAVDGMTIDREPAQVSIAGRRGYRVDFSGVGLFRSMFAVEIRCHVVTFNLTSRDQELLASMVRSLDSLVPARRDASKSVPECIKDYARENVVYQVEPHAVGTRSETIPLRVIVTTDGSVRNVHVIRASAAQQRSVEDAVRQWKFKPYTRDGRPIEVETGVVLKLQPANM
jgi:TonB family protein